MESFIGSVQRILKERQLDGWLIYDYRGSNRAGRAALGIPPDAHLTRRWLYWIPAKGDPTLIVSPLDAQLLNLLVGQLSLYNGRREFVAQLGHLLRGSRRIALEYSPRAELPAVSGVDIGTADLLREAGVELAPSLDLLAEMVPGQSHEQQTSHRRAVYVATRVMHEAWKWLSEGVRAGLSMTEVDVQDFILDGLGEMGMITEGQPICAVNDHSANPHHIPTKSRTLTGGDWVLIDLWCKEKGGIYADITHVGALAAAPTPRQRALFEIVRGAREAALALVRQRMEEKQRLEGWEVDAACRRVFEQAGMLNHCLHRTGHDIGTELHGPGTNLDDFESHDTRALRAGSCFSVEPALYVAGELGVRLECDVLLTPDGRIEVTGDPQSAPRLLPS
jgi:Xaa-Pro dipeptidase